MKRLMTAAFISAERGSHFQCGRERYGHTRTMIATRALLALMVLACHTANGQSESQEFRMGVAAGAYVAAVENVRILKTTECGYALPAPIPSFDKILESEVLPAFPQAQRAQLSDILRNAQQQTAANSRQSVTALIIESRKNSGKSTACGIAAGVLTSKAAQLYEAWNTLKAQSRMAEWVRVGGNAEGTTYADPSSIGKSGNMAKMWILNDFKTAMAEGNTKPYLSMKRHQEYDCKARKLRSLAITVHTGNMGSGSLVHSGTDDMQWLPITSGSIREATWKFACGIR